MNILRYIIIGQDNPNDQIVSITHIPFSDGDKVTAGTSILGYENSKTTAEVYAEVDGYIYYSCKLNDEIEIGKAVAKIVDVPLESKMELLVEGETGSSETKAVEPRFSNAAKAMIEAHGIERQMFEGLDFVTLIEAKKIVERRMAGKSPEVINVDNEKLLSKSESQVIVEPITPEKRTEIRYLSQVQSANLNSSVFISVCSKPLLDYMLEKSSFFKKSILPIVIKEVHALLATHRQFNAFFADNAICKYPEIVVGIALDIGKGLRVVKLPNLAKASLTEIEVVIYKQVQKYLSNQLTTFDLVGSTFTITDLSQDGVVFFTPLINRNQSAILSVAAPSVNSGESILGLTFDHRVASGRDAALFLHGLRERMSSYRLEVKANPAIV